MEVILLEKIQNLGHLGDIVQVKDGYARNFLIPAGKAQRATKENKGVFEERRKELEAQADKILQDAQSKAESMGGLVLKVSEQASVEGRLFGSVTNHDIASLLKSLDHDIQKSLVQLPHGPIKQVGEHPVTISLHPDVAVEIKILVESD